MKSDRISKQLKMKNIRWEYFYKTLILDLHVCHHLLYIIHDIPTRSLSSSSIWCLCQVRRVSGSYIYNVWVEGNQSSTFPPILTHFSFIQANASNNINMNGPYYYFNLHCFHGNHLMFQIMNFDCVSDHIQSSR